MRKAQSDRVPASRDEEAPSKWGSLAARYDVDPLLSVEEVADILGVCTRTVWSFRSQGILEAVKLGRASRFRLSDIQRLTREGVAA